MNYHFLQWMLLVQKLPLVCEVSQVTEWAPSTGAFGLPCTTPVHNWVSGKLTVETVTDGWVFKHPGFKEGAYKVHAFMGDTSAMYSHIYIRDVVPTP